MCDKVEKYGDEREKKGRLEGRLKGRQEGKEEGKYKESIEIAWKIIASGKLTLEDIAACTGLPLSKIKELAG